MTRTPFTSVTPMIPTGGSLADALAYYRDQLGFTIDWETAQMAGISRGDVAFNLVVNDDRHWADNQSFSIGVGDLDAFYAEIRAVDGTVKPPTAMPWGRREVHVIVPSGVCFQFYQDGDG